MEMIFRIGGEKHALRAAAFSLILLWIGVVAGEKFHRGAVASNGKECAAIGSKILNQNGSAADAAIAMLFCEEVTCPQSMGLGGGFILTIYTKETGVTESLIARETAPAAAHKNMFLNVTEITGPLAIGVPGQLKGYWELHKKYGKLPWSTLIHPTIKLCKKGNFVNEYLASVLEGTEELIKNTPALREMFINPKTNSVWKQGDYIKRPKLAATLKIIAKEGADALYNNGTLAQDLVNDVQMMGGILTTEDLMNYNVRWEKPEVVHLSDNNTLYTAPLPGTGSVLAFILNVFNGFLPKEQTLTNFHRVVETFKYAFASRTKLGDSYYVPEALQTISKLTNPAYADYIRAKIEDKHTYQNFQHYGAKYAQTEDHGTAHLSVLAPNGDAVSVTTSINALFGSNVVSNGIILNNQMDDFSTPGVINIYGIEASPANYIEPGKRPLSSMCPSIIVDENGDVRLVIGAAGGSKITTTVAYIIARHLWFNEPIQSAIQAKRFHHQLQPMSILYEQGFDPELLQGLAGIGHELELSTDRLFAAATGISRIGNTISASNDLRRDGNGVVI